MLLALRHTSAIDAGFTLTRFLWPMNLSISPIRDSMRDSSIFYDQRSASPEAGQSHCITRRWDKTNNRRRATSGIGHSCRLFLDSNWVSTVVGWNVSQTSEGHSQNRTFRMVASPAEQARRMVRQTMDCLLGLGREMITPGFYPLALGLAVTSVLIAYRDLARGWVYWFDWLPALGGIGYFYVTGFNLTLLLTGLILATVMVGASWATLRFVHKRDHKSAVVGGGDYLAIGLFAFWPAMMVIVVVYALTVGIAGFYLKWWNRGLRGIPLAGLMGVFCIAYIAYATLV